MTESNMTHRDTVCQGQWWNGLLTTIISLIATITIAGCAINPATGSRQFTLYSEAQEIEMGETYDPEIVAEMGLYPDDRLQDYINELGTKLAALSERPHLPWSFKVLDDPIVNAFALPGGYIYVTRGILAHLNSEAELAGVLGHEIGHVTARHSVGRMSTQQLARFGLALGTAVRPELEGVAGLASAGLQLAFLKYGRDDERQADDLGVRYMLRANYDPREMPHVFEMLERVTEDAGGGDVPEWLSTHPNPGNRRERIAAQVEEYEGDLSNAVAARDSYLQRLNGLIYGENPREGFFKGSRFLHPDLEFEFTFPQAWRTFNQKRAVAGISPNQDAIIEIRLAEGADPEEAARAFLSSSGVAAGPLSRVEMNGLPAVNADFQGAIDGTPIRGRATFVDHRGDIYRIVAYSVESTWSANNNALRGGIRSFAPLTDPEALAVEPLRIETMTLDRAMSLAEFMEAYPSEIPAEKVALLNQAELETRFEAGTILKRVVRRR